MSSDHTAGCLEIVVYEFTAFKEEEVDNAKEWADSRIYRNPLWYKLFRMTRLEGLQVMAYSLDEEDR